MTGYDEERRRQAAMGDRNSRGRRRGDGARDARDDVVWDRRALQRQRFFTATSEYVRIAALQPHHALATACRADHQRVNGVLCHRMTSRTFADEESLRLARVAQDAVVDERVVQNEI